MPPKYEGPAIENGGVEGSGLTLRPKIQRENSPEKQKIVSDIMDKFLTDMTAEDKKKIMSEVTPQMMEGFDMAVIMPQMMMAMMGRGQQKEGMSGTMPMGVNITGKTKESNESTVQEEEGGKK